MTGTLDTASISTGGSTTDTVAVPGVALGDMVIGFSTGLSEAGVLRRAYVSAANVVTVATDNNTGGTVDLTATTMRFVVGRMV